FAAATARRRDPGLTALAVALVGVNPVIVVHTVGGGHNDALVCVGLAAAAFVASGVDLGSNADGRRSGATGGRVLAVTAVLPVPAIATPREDGGRPCSGLRWPVRTCSRGTRRGSRPSSA